MGNALRKTRSLQFACLVVAFSVAPAYQNNTGETMSSASFDATAEMDVTSALSSAPANTPVPVAHSPSLPPKLETYSDALEKGQGTQEASLDPLVEQHAIVEDPVQGYPSAPTPRKENFSYLAYYVYSEIPPDKKPADTVLDSLKKLPMGTPVEEIRRAADAFGLDFNFMKAVAKIESGFNPKQRTGSYIGLFQLSNYEFREFGSGKITDPRDNSVAGAYKFATEALLFEYGTGKKPTFSDLYLIHQQGWQGAAQHVSHPDRVAWKSMCATDEGKEKGERWCKRAIWGNTLPAIKHLWKSVDKLTSGAFVAMWRQRVENLYSHYSLAATKN